MRKIILILAFVISANATDAFMCQYSIDRLSITAKYLNLALDRGDRDHAKTEVESSIVYMGWIKKNCPESMTGEIDSSTEKAKKLLAGWDK